MKVAMIDPSGWSYYYDCILTNEISKYCDIELLTEQFEYDLKFSPAKNTKHVFLKISKIIAKKIRSKKILLLVRGIEYLKNLVDVYYYLKKQKFDAIHIQWCPLPPMDLLFIRLIKNNLKIPVIYTVHNILPHTVRNYHKYFFSKIYDAVDQMIVHSESIAFELVNLFPINRSNIFVVELPLFDIYHIKNPSKDEARNSLNIALSEKVALFFGIIEDYKGLDILLEAIKLVKQKGLNLKLIIAGKCEDFSKYQKIIEEYLIDNNIIKFLYFCSSNLVEKLFCAADVFILPYKKVYGSGCLLTGIAFNKPVIVTNTGHLSEVITDSEHGFVVPPNNPNALAEAIHRFFTMPHREVEKICRNLELLKENYLPSRIAKMTYDVYLQSMR